MVGLALSGRNGSPQISARPGALASPAISQTGSAAPSARPTPPTVPTQTPAQRGTITNPSLDRVEMIDPQHGWATPGSGNPGAPAPLLSTADGGASWTGFPVLGVSSLIGWTALDAQHAWFVATSHGSTSPSVFRTSDGGSSWQSSPIAQDSAGTLLHAIDATHLVLIAQQGAAGSVAVTISASNDSGATWNLVSTSDTSHPQGRAGVPFECDKSVTFKDTQTPWAAGACNTGQPFFDVSHDGGVHWAAQTVPLPPTPGVSFDAPTFLSVRDGYFAARVGQQEPQYLYRTHDGGATWTYAPAPASAYAVQAIAVRHAVVIRDDGTVFTSSDDGGSWSTMARHPEFAYTNGTSQVDAQYLDADHAFFLVHTIKSTLYRSNDGGRTLQRVSR